MNIVERNQAAVIENSHLMDDDTFVVLSEDGTANGVYYNPDSNAGGQLVYTEISAENLLDELNALHEDERTPANIEQVLVCADSRELDELVDVDQECFVGYLEDIETGVANHDLAFWCSECATEKMFDIVYAWCVRMTKFQTPITKGGKI